MSALMALPRNAAWHAVIPRIFRGSWKHTCRPRNYEHRSRSYGMTAHNPRCDQAFVLSQTQPSSVPLVPEITLHLATEITPIWQATEAWCHTNNAEPPFWAFAWPGGQALARHILDRPATVTGRRILDFAAGCGIAAI